MHDKFLDRRGKVADNTSNPNITQPLLSKNRRALSELAQQKR